MGDGIHLDYELQPPFSLVSYSYQGNTVVFFLPNTYELNALLENNLIKIFKTMCPLSDVMFNSR